MKINSFKKGLAWILSLAVILGLLPAVMITASAASPAFALSADFSVHPSQSPRSVVGLPGDKTAVLQYHYDATGTVTYYLSIYSSDGSVLLNEKNISALMDTKYKGEECSILPLSNGNIAVAYGKGDSSAAILTGSSESNPGAYFMILDQSGNKVLGQTKINASDPSTVLTRAVSMAQLPNGNIAFSWQRNDNISIATRVYTQSGAAATAETVLISGNAYQNAIAAGADGKYMVVYSNSEASQYAFYYAILDSVTGTVIKTQKFADGNSMVPLVAALTNGNYLYGAYYYNTRETGIYLCDASGNPIRNFTLDGSLLEGNMAISRATGSEGFVLWSYDEASVNAVNNAYNTNGNWSGTQYVHLKYYDNNGDLQYTTASPVDSGNTALLDYDADSWDWNIYYSPWFYLSSGYDRGFSLYKINYTSMADYTSGIKLFDMGTSSTYTATVTVNKDGGAWTADAPVITIGTASATASDNGSAFSNGTYNIYANGVDTGADITVSGTAATAILNYYTLTLTAGTGITSVSGSGVYLSGTTVNIDAVVMSGSTWGKWSDDNTAQARSMTVSSTISLTAIAMGKEATPSANFTAAGSDSGTLENVDATMKYSVDGGSTWIDITDTIVEITGVTEANGVQVKKSGDSTTTTDSDPQLLTVTKAATPALTPTQPAAIGDMGSIPTTTAHEYSTNGGSSYTDCTGELNNLDPGSYLIRIKANGAMLASDAQSITITAFTGTKEATPSATFTAAGSDSGTLENVDATMKYSVDGGSTWIDITDTIVEITGVTETNGVQVKKSGDSTTTTDSDPQLLTVTKAATPALTPTQPAAIGDMGSIPTTTAHEYSTNGGSSYTDCTGELNNLDPGSYLIRIKANGAMLASDAQSITITAFDATPETQPSATIDYMNEKLTGLTANGSYTVNGAAIIADASGEIPIPNSWFGTTISIVKNGNGITTGDSTAQSVPLPMRPAAPTCAVMQPDGRVSTGAISGITSDMQYSTNNGASWTDGSGADLTDLTVETTVLIRTKAVDNIAPSGMQQSITILAAATYTITLDGSGGNALVTATLTTGTDKKLSSLPTPTRSGSYSFDGWFTAASGGTAVTTDTVFGGDTTIYAHWTYTGGSNPGGGGSNPVNPSIGAPVIVDGKTQNIGTEQKSDTNTTVTVDQRKLSGSIDNAEEGSSVVVPLSQNGTVTAQLVVKNVEDMADKGMTLTVQTGNVAYNLNTSAIDTAALEAAFPNADMSKVPFDVTIKNSSAAVKGETLVLPPVEFTVTATYEGRTVSVDTFNAYIDRVIEVTKEQAAKITTAVVVDASGNTRHVPTYVYEKNGKYYATINSRTNSIYALIENNVTFADATGKWYEAAVNEMGSRKIIEGYGKDSFAGENSITRAEFAAILVRALGLPADGKSTFDDVPSSAWYSGAVATAAQYGLVGGVGNNRFSPLTNITRQEAMLMLQRAAALTEFSGISGSLGSFKDVKNVGSWAKNAAEWSVGSGLLHGSNGRLNPTDDITRAESATIILRLLQEAKLVDVRSKA